MVPRRPATKGCSLVGIGMGCLSQLQGGNHRGKKRMQNMS